MNNPDLLFREDVMRDGARKVKQVNKELTKMLGINPAARTTCTKPEGNTSVLLKSASGIHSEHAPRYFRNVQMNEMDNVLHIINTYNPKMVEKSVWSNTGTDSVVSFPVVSDKRSIFKKDLTAIQQLEYVKKAQQIWVEEGTNEELCVDKRLRHNISNTITVDDWDEVTDFLYDNRKFFAGVSFLSQEGDRAYPQAPFTEVYTSKQILDMYGDASLFASGLIVDGLVAFNNNLWLACNTMMGVGEDLKKEDKTTLLKRDWVRRAKKFARNYFDNDEQKMVECLKDCYNLHKWNTIMNTFVEIDFKEELKEVTYVDADTMAAEACAGGACEVSF